MLNYGERENLRLIISKVLALYHINQAENGGKMKQNLITYELFDEILGKIKQIKIEYDFEKNCWIIKDNISLTAAFSIANKLKRKYYKNKTWIVSWNYKNLKINFIDER